MIAIVALATLCGCRREDIREFTVQLPSLTEADRQKVVEAFTIRSPGRPPHTYEGVFTDSFKFDFDAKTLTMKYDSMKIAQTNIRMLIQSKGVEVLFPSNTTGVAGYLDVKPKSVD
ncbi:MAG: hypothetical protein J5727_07190 [Kiritimatiellae bacterium]|nr:hypothetical protein [Kiritimatiellia bacterium]